MKILHTEASTGWGGQEIRILREAIGMRQRGHEVVLAVETGGKLATKARQEGFTVYELSFQKRSWPRSLFRLYRMITRHQIELVNTHSSLDGWIGGIAARLAQVRVIRTRHLSTPIRKGLNSRLLYGSLADFVVTTCEEVVSRIVEQSKRSPDTCRSIPTGVDPFTVEEEEIRAFRKRFGEENFLVGMTCVMRSWKGVEEFLRAAHLLRHIPQLKWILIGGGHESTYRKIAQELKLEGIVHFTGHLDRPFPAIAALDLFLLLSTANEGVSQALLQAAYLKRPLVTTPTGGLREVCRPHETGELVPTFDEKSVADAVLRLMKDPGLRAQYGANARKAVESKFLLSHTLDGMEDVYRKVCTR